MKDIFNGPQDRYCRGRNACLYGQNKFRSLSENEGRKYLSLGSSFPTWRTGIAPSE